MLHHSQCVIGSDSTGLSHESTRLFGMFECYRVKGKVDLSPDLGNKVSFHELDFKVCAKWEFGKRIAFQQSYDCSWNNNNKKACPFMSLVTNKFLCATKIWMRFLCSIKYKHMLVQCLEAYEKLPHEFLNLILKEIWSYV